MTIVSDTLVLVVERMRTTGDYIVGINGRYYWANDKVSGCLIEAAGSFEVLAAQTASGKDGIILREFKTIEI